jgi:hypothetical protein
MKFKSVLRISAILLVALVLLSILAAVPAGAAEEVQQVPELQLTPEEATNPICTSHTLTATLVLPDAPQLKIAANTEVVVAPQIMVHFEVIAGPHKGAKGDVPLGEDLTAQWSYTGTKTGTDTIKASISVREEVVLESNKAYKTWKDDGVPPVPELPTVALLGIGLLAVAGFVGVRRIRTSRA